MNKQITREWSTNSLVHVIWQDYPEIEQGLIQVKQIIHRDLSIKTPEINQKIRDYIDAPGKYLRAGLCLMFAKLVDDTISDETLHIAAAIEVMHLATLIHDDVIDEADTRRGLNVLNQQMTNRIAIYTGDYLLVYAARLMKKAQRKLEGSPIDEWVLENILNGEMSQLSNQFKRDMTMYQYLRQVRGKTAMLFALATFGGYADTSMTRRNKKRAFYVGQDIGMAFQLTDDLIDFRISKEATGKPQLQDVQNGIYTAPILLAMEASGVSIRSRLLERNKIWSDKQLQDLVVAIDEEGAFERTEELVSNYLGKAFKRLDQVTDSPYKETIKRLVNQIMQRQF